MAISPETTTVTYSNFSICDSDDWPDRDYEVEFNGQKELLTKQGRHYLARRKLSSLVSDLLGVSARRML